MALIFGEGLPLEYARQVRTSPGFTDQECALHTQSPEKYRILGAQNRIFIETERFIFVKLEIIYVLDLGSR